MYRNRILPLAALATFAIAGSITAAHASTADSSVTQDVVFGGVTGVAGANLQGYPVVLELNKTATKVLNANIVLDLACAMPPNATGIGDDYDNLAIARGAFKSAFGPQRIPANAATGTGPLDVSGSIAGRVNHARTKITGTWSLKIVTYDPADPTGATVKDTCDSGAVKYTAKN